MARHRAPRITVPDYNISQAADYLAVDPRYVRSLVGRGQLKAYHPSRNVWRFALPDLAEFRARNTIGA